MNKWDRVKLWLGGVIVGAVIELVLYTIIK